jgi:hypothetical protein
MVLGLVLNRDSSTLGGVQRLPCPPTSPHCVNASPPHFQSQHADRTTIYSILTWSGLPHLFPAIQLTVSSELSTGLGVAKQYYRYPSTIDSL